MVFFDRIKRLKQVNPFFAKGLKISTQKELTEMDKDKTGKNVVSGKYSNWLIRADLADRNYAITRDDLIKILEMIG